MFVRAFQLVPCSFYKADELRVATEEFLIDKCRVRQAEVVGERLPTKGGSDRRASLPH